MGTVLYEMATFLYWVELFDLPAEDRMQEIISLLTTFVRTKHNGMVDRLNNGKEHEVIRQVEQAVRAVAKNRYPGCLEHFARIRQRRDRGPVCPCHQPGPADRGRGTGPDRPYTWVLL